MLIITNHIYHNIYNKHFSSLYQEKIKMKKLLLLLLKVTIIVVLMNNLASIGVMGYGPVLIRGGVRDSCSQIELPKTVHGPESIAFDCHGKGPYVGVSDGRILKWHQQHRSWTQFAVTSATRDKKLCDGLTNTTLEPLCGRPLGLKFNTVTCDLYIADAYFGLVVVGAAGGVAKQLVHSADKVPLKFTNALDINTQTGEVYFTDSSSIYQRRSYLPIILTDDSTGRLLKYDPRTKQVHVVLNGLAFPNGVALSKDNSFLLLAVSDTFKILKIHINNNNNNINNKNNKNNPNNINNNNYYYVQHFATLPRYSDNIKRNEKGEFWVALNSGRGKIQGLVKDHENIIGKNVVDPLSEDPVGIKFDEEGNLIEVIDGGFGDQLDSVSEVEEFGGRLWLGSNVQPYVGVINPTPL
ncbi:hypothetical protein HN51_061044 [Arachis hypogaea]|uniref:Strictosidine synthase conserved region domain-containing protein n=2 Tax=Arachis hypogaea TaxID=3818 RepID=A0A445AM29_ARAHY|nr:hypothetical protein Ahy_B01g051458 [Arachis hypogaea]